MARLRIVLPDQPSVCLSVTLWAASQQNMNSSWRQLGLYANNSACTAAKNKMSCVLSKF